MNNQNVIFYQFNSFYKILRELEADLNLVSGFKFNRDLRLDLGLGPVSLSYVGCSVGTDVGPHVGSDVGASVGYHVG